MSSYEDLVGKVFGDLIVISQAESNFSIRKERGNLREIRKWKCKCICGNEYEAFEQKLKNGNTRDCGCRVDRSRIGENYGRLTITGYRSNYEGRTIYECECDCGDACFVKYSDLTRGKVLSCGCLFKEYKNSKTHDLTGLKFGRLTVIKELNYKVRNNRMWLCECECGNKAEVKGINLDSGTTKSCGCYAKDLTIERSRKYNEYDFIDDYVIIRDEKDNEMYIDLDDFNRLECTKYWITPTKTGGYPCYKKEDKYMLIHRDVMNMGEYDGEIMVDHINRNRLDDRKSNLRVVNCIENARNSNLQINNTSGISGVQWHKRDERWYSTIGINGDKIHLGSFNNKEEAIKSRLNAELKYFGYAFSPQRHLFKEYNITD